MFYVYVLRSRSRNHYYVGHTEDIDGRLENHNEGRTKSTKPYVPWEMVYTEEYATRSEAQAREYAIKRKKSKKYIEWLISSVG